MACPQYAVSPETGSRIAKDARADHGTRKITLTTDMIHIERALNGVKMRVHVPAEIYQGVVLLCRASDEGEVYDIRLVHRDPDLGVSLDTSMDKQEAEVLQQQWADFFARPALDEDAQPQTSGQNKVFISAPRRRCMTQIAKRRPRRFARRKPGNLENFAIVRDEREIICYE